MEQEKGTKKVKIPLEEHETLLAKARELEGLKRECEEAKKQLEELKERLLRTAADFDNARKRMSKEQLEQARFANETFVRGLLPVLDNFERAILNVSSQGSNNPPSVADGISLIKRQLTDFLSSQGLARLEVVGKRFDPHFHEAMGHSASEEHPEETVVEELEAGYLFHGRLLRPAKVRISKAKDSPETT